MRAAVLHGPGDVRLDDVADPAPVHPTDAVVQVAATCVCGSDLWRYRGVKAAPDGFRLGHECVGTVVATGSQVTSVRVGQFVVVPFSFSCGRCAACRAGLTTSCAQVTWFGGVDPDGVAMDGAQGEHVRVPMADGTLVGLDETPDPGLLASLLTLTDVMGTGYHAAVSAGVGPGSVVAVVGDGAVGLCATLAAAHLGAARVVMFSRHPDRSALARRLGATDVVAERGPDGVAALTELLGGRADAALECVGTEQSWAQAVGSVRPGGTVGFVGLPAEVPPLPVEAMFYGNIAVRGGIAPVQRYLPDLLPAVLDGRLDPGVVLDSVGPLAGVADAYRAMDARTVTKAMLLP